MRIVDLSMTVEECDSAPHDVSTSRACRAPSTGNIQSSAPCTR